MRTYTQLIKIVAFCTLTAFCAGCSPQTNKTPSSTRPPRQSLDKRTTALARKFDCPFLDKEIGKFFGTNRLFSFQIQRILNNNKRLAATGTLIDLVQSTEQIDAVFNLAHLDLGILTLHNCHCIATLECPTNLISLLTSGKDNFSDWGILFDIEANQHSLKSYRPSGVDDPSPESWTLITIHGKLIAVEQPE